MATLITYKRETRLWKTPIIESIIYQGDPPSESQLIDWIKEQNKDIFLDDDNIKILSYEIN